MDVLVRFLEKKLFWRHREVLIDELEECRSQRMSQREVAKRLERQASRLQNMALSTDAQPSTTGEEQSVQESSGQTRRTFSDQLSQLDLGHIRDLVDWAEKSASEEAEGGTTGVTHIPNSRKMLHTLSSKSERLVASQLEQLQLAQLQSPQLRELVRRLKHLYKIESPKDKNWSPERIPNPYAEFQVRERWQEIQGCSQWAGLLDPIDPVLRAEVVRYGEFAQAAYDAFDGDTRSKYCGSCKYLKENVLERVGLDNRGYEIYQYLYATAELDLPNFFTKSFLDDKWSKDSNWIGFVAVCTSPQEIARLGRRDIVVAWRGTITRFEWICDVQDYLAPAGFDPRNGNKDVMVESGFLSVYKSYNEKSRYNQLSARKQALGAVKELIEKYKHEKDTKLSITVTGHSLGSALATLNGYDIAESQINSLVESPTSIPGDWNPEKAEWISNPQSSGLGSGSGPGGVGDLQKPQGKFFPRDRIPVTVFSFAGPRVGNRAFKDRMEELGVAVLRVANKHDMVTKVPGVIFTHALEVLQKVVTFLPSYKHVGVKLKIDSLASHYLKDTTDPVHAHNLEGYLHVVDGYHGKKLPFHPTMRDYTLANKGGDLLKTEFYIPPAWWQEAYKGLVRDKDGHWIMPPRGEELFPGTPSEQSPEKKDEPVRSFYRSVSIAYERSTSRSDYVSLAAAHATANHSGRSSCRLEDDVVDGPVDGAVGGAKDGAVNGVVTE